MSDYFVVSLSNKSIPIFPIQTSEFKAWLKKQSEAVRSWVQANKFVANSADFCLVPNQKTGALGTVLLGTHDADDFWAFAALPKKLPAGQYRPELKGSPEQLERVAIAWGLGSYAFTKYKTSEPVTAKLSIPGGCDVNYIENIVKAINFGRDLINTPNHDFGPEELSRVARDLAKKHKAKVVEIIGEQLCGKNFPAVYAVGKGSKRQPRLIEINWKQNKRFPNITLIGKGVCFDSGGWNLKPPPFMRHMKEDMAGAAYVLTLARVIMELKLPVNLQVIIPAIENLLADVSYKPGDIVTMRNGKKVEIHDTDAEGRLILADALVYACEEKTDLVLDFASLTGSARVALGTEINAMFTNDDKLAVDLSALASEEHDQLWRLPMYEPYWETLHSNIADFCNCSDVRYGGSITAALFLKRFVKKDVKWVHFDIAAWNYKTRPGHPEGGAVYCIPTLFRLIKELKK